MNWIKCSDKLPEDGQDVLAYIERDAWDDSGCFRKKAINIGWQIRGNWHGDGCSDVVGLAWMPLPDPPDIEGV